MNKFAVGATKAWNIFAHLAAVFLFINVAFIVAGIIMRRFFNAPIFGGIEIIRYISLTSASFALSQNEWVGGNVRMTLILEQLSDKANRVADFVTGIICSIAFIFISYLLIVQAVNKYSTVNVRPELHFPMWIPAAVLAAGFCILAASLICKTIVYYQAMKTGVKIDLRGYVIGTTDEEVLE